PGGLPRTHRANVVLGVHAAAPSRPAGARSPAGGAVRLQDALGVAAADRRDADGAGSAHRARSHQVAQDAPGSATSGRRIAASGRRTEGDRVLPGLTGDSSTPPPRTA